jgi:hypothetical protein
LAGKLENVIVTTVALLLLEHDAPDTPDIAVQEGDEGGVICVGKVMINMSPVEWLTVNVMLKV